MALSMEEHSNATNTGGDRRSISEFQEVVRVCDLLDLSHSGPQFTWTNNQDDNPISKKLDRVLVNGCWLSSFPQSHAIFEAGGVSDHMRICTQLRALPQGNMKPLKFSNHLVGHPKFLETVAHI